MSTVEHRPVDPAQFAATEDRILDEAERLFAEHGIEGASVRAITAAAGVNVAAVNYHFGSKDALVKRVIERRFDQLEGARLKALDLIEEKATNENRAPSPYELVEAMIGPAFDHARSDQAGWTHFIRFLSRLAWEPAIERIERPRESEELFKRFDDAICRAVPELAGDDGRRSWRVAFMRGAAQNTLLMLTAIRLNNVPKAGMLIPIDPAVDSETIKRELLTFVAAGLAAKSQG